MERGTVVSNVPTGPSLSHRIITTPVPVAVQEEGDRPSEEDDTKNKKHFHDGRDPTQREMLENGAWSKTKPRVYFLSLF